MYHTWKNLLAKLPISHSEGFCQSCSGEWSWHSFKSIQSLCEQVNAKSYTACQDDHISYALVFLSWWCKNITRWQTQIHRPWQVPEWFAEDGSQCWSHSSNGQHLIQQNTAVILEKFFWWNLKWWKFCHISPLDCFHNPKARCSSGGT